MDTGNAHLRVAQLLQRTSIAGARISHVKSGVMEPVKEAVGLSDGGKKFLICTISKHSVAPHI